MKVSSYYFDIAVHLVVYVGHEEVHPAVLVKQQQSTPIPERGRPSAL